MGCSGYADVEVRLRGPVAMTARKAFLWAIPAAALLAAVISFWSLM
jgi:hypothetical protein